MSDRKSDLLSIQEFFEKSLSRGGSSFKTKGSLPGNIEFSGTFQVMQGKQKVDGHYFASVVPKPKDIRFYYFPIYTHVSEFGELSPEMKKCLKGKSCFHVKKLTPELEAEFIELIDHGIKLCKRDGLI